MVIWGILILLGLLMIAVVLYCCVRVGAEADIEMEKLFEESSTHLK